METIALIIFIYACSFVLLRPILEFIGISIKSLLKRIFS